MNAGLPDLSFLDDDCLPVLQADATPESLPIDWHLLWDERSAIMEYEGRLPREQAEQRALREILDRMRQDGRSP